MLKISTFLWLIFENAFNIILSVDALYATGSCLLAKQPISFSPPPLSRRFPVNPAFASTCRLPASGRQTPWKSATSAPRRCTRTPTVSVARSLASPHPPRSRPCPSHLHRVCQVNVQHQNKCGSVVRRAKNRFLTGIRVGLESVLTAREGLRECQWKLKVKVQLMAKMPFGVALFI